jgi:hypothetical protein
MAIAVALSFDCGILLCADSKDNVRGQVQPESTKIFQRQYGSNPVCARSIFLTSERVKSTISAIRHCERALDAIRPTEYTFDRMRDAIEYALFKIDQEHFDSQLQSKPQTTLLVALYAHSDRQCSLFRTNGTELRELIGYDCQGIAAYLGHYLIHERYRAAQSMGTLDLTTVFSIAIETIEGMKEYRRECRGSAEAMILYADGRVSDVQTICLDTGQERNLEFKARASGA